MMKARGKQNQGKASTVLAQLILEVEEGAVAQADTRQFCQRKVTRKNSSVKAQTLLI
jgi:hypothetical protein